MAKTRRDKDGNHVRTRLQAHRMLTANPAEYARIGYISHIERLAGRCSASPTDFHAEQVKHGRRHSVCVTVTDIS